MSTPPSLSDSLFQPSLHDMIQSLRSPSNDSPPIPLLLTQIRREIRCSDPSTKSAALQKLAYLSSLHSLDASWASFHALELLPSPSPAYKRAAYFFASLTFHPSATDLLPLATHQTRKDIQSPNPHVSSPALHLLALSSSPDLAVHLSDQLFSVFSSGAAVITSLYMIRFSPDRRRLFLPKLVDALDPASPLVSAAAGVFCELVCGGGGDAGFFVYLAPEFHRVLVECRSNWVLIKVLKIFGVLVGIEPRLRGKLGGPILDLMRRSTARSVVFECVRVVFAGGFGDEGEVFRVAAEKVKGFVAAEEDPNLRLLGLCALGMVGRGGNSWAVEESRDVIVRALADVDSNIRREALKLVMNMVFENNVVEISGVLIGYALGSDPEFSNEILEAVLAACGRNFYELVMDFDWYVSVLAEVVKNPFFAKGEEVERQLVDVGLRVKEARFELFRVSRVLLIDPALLGNQFLHRVLSAAAWISGEYIGLSRNPLEIVEALLQPRTNLLPSLVRAVYIQAVFKVVTFCFNSFANSGGGVSDSICNVDDSSDVAEFKLESLEMKELLTSKSIVYMLNLIVTALAPLSECDEVEVQERARHVLGFVHVLNGIEEWKADDGEWRNDSKIRDIVRVTNSIFSEELGPVSIHAQKRVLVPEGLELKENLSDLDVILRNNDAHPPLSISFSSRMHSRNEDTEKSEAATESTSLLAEHRKRHGLYYLPTEKDENGSNEYPRANDSTNSVSSDNATNDLLKLTDQSLLLGLNKPLKPRPTVVKLDEGVDLPSSSSEPVKEPKEDILSSAVRDALSASVDSSLKDNSVMQEREIGSSSSRKSKHHSHGKEKNKSSKKSEAKEEKRQRSGRHHGRHKIQQRVESGYASLDIAPQNQVIQDFLL